MRRFPLLASIVVLLAVPITTQAQQTSTFTRPTVTFRGGAVQTVNGRASGLAPYVEAQSRVHVGKTPFGLALYGGFSYERSSESSRVVCIVAPCPQWQSQESHFDLATGVRVGLFPQEGPVDAFVGVASHFVRGEEKRVMSTGEMSNLIEEVSTWGQRSTIEGGVNVQIPVGSRFRIEGGVLGFLPVHVGEETPSDAGDRLDLDMQRYGFHLGVQYAL